MQTIEQLLFSIIYFAGFKIIWFKTSFDVNFSNLLAMVFATAQNSQTHFVFPSLLTVILL